MALMSLTIHGRFFHLHGKRSFLRAVTYGPFPPEQVPDHDQELAEIAAAGFNALRLYQSPNRKLLDLAVRHRLTLLVTIPWNWDSLFTEDPETLSEAQQKLTVFLSEHGSHPALGAVLIANEIAPDLVRFMGPVKVRDRLEELFTFARGLAPELLYAYANYPTTEYLEPRNADFTAFNVYLEQQSDFLRYLARLHNLAGDRPLLITEFGFNTHDPEKPEPLSSSLLEEKQAEVLAWGLQASHAAATAGMVVYAWSDRWFTGGREVRDWSFGLKRRDQSAKPALAALSQIATPLQAVEFESEKFTVAICSRNGGARLQNNLPFFELIEDANFELIVINDGSSDDTEKVVQEFMAASSLEMQYSRQSAGGLSLARNHAARLAKGSFIAYIDDDARPHSLWLYYLRQAFQENEKAAAAGGPNIPPVPSSWSNALVTACRDNVSHILYTDKTAEHVPGCNMAFRVADLLSLGGFDPRFLAAGDDVDICWRLLDAGHEIGFHPAATVSHDRRGSFREYLRQQGGYGRAEALLYQKHKHRFGTDGIRWEGFIYSGGPVSPTSNFSINHGLLGAELFQSLHLNALPKRGLCSHYDNRWNRMLVNFLERFSKYYRRRSRRKLGVPSQEACVEVTLPKEAASSCHTIGTSSLSPRQDVLAILQKRGWIPSEEIASVDLEKEGQKILLAQSHNGPDLRWLHVKAFPPVEKQGSLVREIESLLKTEG